MRFSFRFGVLGGVESGVHESESLVPLMREYREKGEHIATTVRKASFLNLFFCDVPLICDASRNPKPQT